MRTYDSEAMAGDDWGRGVVPAMDHSAGGVKSAYDPRIGREIIDKILNGQTVTRIAAEPDMPCYATIYRWTKMHADFAWRFRGARAHMAWEKARKVMEREALKRRRALASAAAEGRRSPRGWRRSAYDPALARAFCGRVARGQTLTAICARDDMPSMKVVGRWLRQIPAFREAYVAARARRQATLAVRADMAADAALEAETRAEVVMAKRKAARIEARMGRLLAKTWREGALADPVPPARAPNLLLAAVMAEVRRGKRKRAASA